VANEQIWAPWRLQYVQNSNEKAANKLAGDSLEFLPGADPKCFLCQAVADSAKRQRYVVCQGRHSLVVLNRYPYNNGHLLVAPLVHCGRLNDLSADQRSDLTEGISRMIAALEAVIHPDGFNVGLNLGRVAGAGLPGHLHWHVVPRWNGDTNFMPVLAGANVIPQSLEALWDAMTAELAKQGG
jgi:ATP adenylyltransferase